MFVGMLSGLAAVTLAFGGLAVVALIGASASGLIPSNLVVNSMKGKVAGGMLAYWVGIGVAAGLAFGGLSWWMLSNFASAEYSISRFVIAAVGGTFVGLAVALASIHLGRKILGRFPIPAATSKVS